MDADVPPQPDPIDARLAPPPPASFSLRASLSALLQIVLCSGLPTQLAITGLLVALGVARTPADLMAPGLIATVALVDTVLIVALIVLFLTAGGERPRDVLFGGRLQSIEIGLGLALVPVVFIGLVASVVTLQHLAPALHNVKDSPLEAFYDTPFHRALFAVVAIVAGGVREELQRGFILHRFEQRLGGATVGLVISSVAFGAGHFIQGYDVAVAMILVGLAWGLLTLKRRSVVASMTCHAGFNAIEVALGFLKVMIPVK